MTLLLLITLLSQANPSPEPAYKFTNQFEPELSAMCTSAPGVIKAERIGQSVEKNSIWAYRISSPKQEPRAKVLVFAALHPMEWLGTEVALEVIGTLVEHPSEWVEVIVVPVVNIDRRLLVEKELREGENKYRRSNSAGIDLNRDFEWHRVPKTLWRHVFPARYKMHELGLSQPESQALDRLAAAESFDAVVSLHAFGGYIYYPWAALRDRPERWREHHELAVTMQRAQSEAWPYRVKQLSHWMLPFRVHGTELDHFYGKYDSLSFLIELSRSGYDLWNPETWSSDFRMYNPLNPAADIRRGSDSVMALIRAIEDRHRFGPLDN